ncbi:MAG: hypothetical protein K2X64_01990 [Rhodocyclaceae bacterium]|nr:hypothetical protein [Rhodocyclaceae bacterium]
MKCLKTFCLLFVLAGLSACTTLRTVGSTDRYWLKSEAHLGMDDAVSLLYYASYTRNLSATERERELERQRSAHARDKSDFRRLQYALVLSTPEASMNERRLAQQVIEPLLEGKHDADLVALAGLLNFHLSAMLQGQKRADELEKKLDAVKDIERSLLRRDKGKP